MNKNKVKFKYLLGLWKSLPQYPTKEDIIYEISVFLLKEGKPNGEFSNQSFRSVFGNDWSSKYGDIINEMINSGDLEETSKSNGTKKWYRIKSNVYYSN